MTARRFEINGPTVIGEIVDGEVMVMNLRDGIYYSVAGDGAAIWQALTHGCALDAIAGAVSSIAGVPPLRVAGDLDTFVQTLEAEAILRPASGDEASPMPPIGAIGDYRGFAIERFDDMRALLVIDPVHEVGEFGWPQQGEPKAQ